MPNLVIGLAALVLGLLTLRAVTRMKPAALARQAPRAAAAFFLTSAIWLLFRGIFLPALVLGALGLWFAGVFDKMADAVRRGNAPKPGARSSIRSAMIEMVLDHDSGAMTGQVLAGPYEGRSLDDLDRNALLAVLRVCEASDAQGARLLEAYLDRRFAGWREAGEGDAGAGPDGGARSRGARGRQTMSEQEAYEVLGLEPGSGRDAIVSRHRALMKRWHPDHGGSADLAARANEAKDVLLKRHR